MMERWEIPVEAEAVARKVRLDYEDETVSAGDAAAFIASHPECLDTAVEEAVGRIAHDIWLSKRRGSR